MKRCINGGNFIRLLFLLTELFKFEIQNVVKFCVHISPIFSCPVTYLNCVHETKNVISSYHKLLSY